MILDQQNYLSKLQANVLTVALYPSTNVIDLTQVTNYTPISGMFLVCRVVAAFTTAASGTVTFRVVCSAAAGLGTPTIFYNSGPLAVATLVANYLVLAMRVPATIPLRYFGMTYEVVTGTVADGTITTFLTPDIPFVSIL